MSVTHGVEDQISDTEDGLNVTGEKTDGGPEQSSRERTEIRTDYNTADFGG